MLYYDKIDISEGVDVNKTNESRKYICRLINFKCICDYYYFLKAKF